MQNLSADQIVEFINSRQSIGHLVEPAPNLTQLNQAIEAALTAPDHHRLHPWKFILIEGEKRIEFGQLMASCLEAEGEADQVQLDRVKQHPLRAPMILICVMSYKPHLKVPHYEQVLSSGAGIQNLLLTLHAQGFSTMWRSGAIAESAILKRALGCSANDEIAGLVYIGTSVKEIAPRHALNVSDFLSTW